MTRILFSDSSALADRCSETGVRTSSTEGDYDEGAVVPLCNWQRPTDATLAHLQAGAGSAPGTVVEIVRVPIDRAWARAAMPERAGDFDPFAGRGLSEFLGYVDQEPEQLTTTMDVAAGRRVGLHVDNFDRLPFTRRTEGRRRLGVNFGPGPRYLLLGTIDILAVCREVDPDHLRRYPHTDDVRRYVQRGKNLRCLRIRLEPGEGYIAPTELLPHDGSTWQISQPSRVAFWLGRWPLAILPTLV